MLAPSSMYFVYGFIHILHNYIYIYTYAFICNLYVKKQTPSPDIRSLCLVLRNLINSKWILWIFCSSILYARNYKVYLHIDPYLFFSRLTKCDMLNCFLPSPSLSLCLSKEWNTLLCCLLYLVLYLTK